MAKVRDYMHMGLVTAPAGSSVSEAAAVMQQHDMGSVLVMDGETLLGIFTERDAVRVLAQNPEGGASPVSDWTTKDVETIGPDATPADAISIMLQRHFRHLPVLEDGKLIGVLSMRDLMSLEPALRSSG